MIEKLVELGEKGLTKILEKIREANEKNNMPAFLIFLNLGLIDVVRRIREVENRSLKTRERERKRV